MGCGMSKAEKTHVRRAVRRCNTLVAVDLEPLVLSDPEAQRAVMDFQRADAGGSGEVLPSDFARVFGLDDDLYLRRLVELFDTTGSGSICLAEFLVGVAHFAGSTSLPRDSLIRRFAFKLMDIDGNGVIPEHNLEQFVMVAYDEFAAKQRDPDNNWGDTVGVRSRAQADVKSCLAGIKRACPDGKLTLHTFEAVAADVPLLVAPAAFIWTTFEHLAPACKFVCAAMNARGHKGFNAAVWGGRPPAQPKRMHGAAPLAARGGGLHSAATSAAAARRPPRRPDALVSDHVAPEDDDPSSQWARAAPAPRPAVARRDRVAPVPGGPTAEDALHRMFADKGSARRNESHLPPQQQQLPPRGGPPPFDPRRQAPAPSPYDAGDVGDYGAYADEPPQAYGNAPPPQQQYANAYGARSQSPAMRPPYGNAPRPPPPQQQPPYGGAYGAPPRWEPASAPQSARFGSNRSGYSPRPEPDSALFELYAMTMQSPREQGRSRLAAAKEVARAPPPVDQRRSFDQPGSRADDWAPYPPQPRPMSARGGAGPYY